MQGVYKIVNLADGKASTYIGSSVNIEHRWQQHRRCLYAGTHHNSHLQCAWDKWGKNAFVFSVLEEVSGDTLLVVEQEYLDDYLDRGHCYNIAQKTAAPFAGRNHTEETKRKISKAAKGKKGKKKPPFSEEHKRRISDALRRRVISEETRRKLSESRKGKLNPNWGKQPTAETRRKLSAASMGNQNALGYKHTEKSKREMSITQTGRKHTEETKQKISESLKRYWTRNNEVVPQTT